MLEGLLLILIAGIFQGAFIGPMGLQKGWSWENGWFIFSLLGMFALNWVVASFYIPDLCAVYGTVPTSDLVVLGVLGIGWGCGSVLFGIGMDKLGMSLGYPIIMGLLALLGTIIPLFINDLDSLFSLKVLLLLLGSVIVLIGIIICTKAHDLKVTESNTDTNHSMGTILIAVGAGVLSCLPNVGASVGKSITEAATATGASSFMAGNAVWAFLFTFGLLPNIGYTIYLLKRNRSFKYFKNNLIRNTLAGLLMSFLWISSFYLYGAGASQMGNWGLIIGWPLFISLSIVIGNVLGLLKGEWTGASIIARKKLNQGMLLIIVAMIIIGICNLF